MRKLSKCWSVIVLAVVLVLPACQRNSAPGNTTQTIAPAASQSAPNDPVTETVNVDDGRSEGEGGSSVTATQKAKQAPAGKAAKQHK